MASLRVKFNAARNSLASDVMVLDVTSDLKLGAARDTNTTLIATVTNSSIRVKPECLRLLFINNVFAG